MTDDPTKPDKSDRYLFSTEIRSLEGSPFGWRTVLSEISSSLARDVIDRKQATQRLVDMIEAVQCLQSTGPSSHRADVRDGVNQHFELAVSEIYEFADEHSLPLARMINKSKRIKPPSEWSL